MICKRCGFERWDGFSRHPYQGRESSGVPCFGPDEERKRRDAIKHPIAATSTLRDGKISAVLAEMVDEDPAANDSPPTLTAKADIMSGKELEEKQARKKAADPKWTAALDKLERKFGRAKAKRSASPKTKKANRKKARG